MINKNSKGSVYLFLLSLLLALLISLSLWRLSFSSSDRIAGLGPDASESSQILGVKEDDQDDDRQSQQLRVLGIESESTKTQDLEVSPTEFSEVPVDFSEEETDTEVIRTHVRVINPDYQE